MGPLIHRLPVARATLQARRRHGSGRQSGFMLVIALIIMIIMTLSSIAMVISLRGGISASANIAFRQAATRSADVAVDSAYQWVRTQMTSIAGIRRLGDQLGSTGDLRPSAPGDG